jgi:hypothetical protein
MSIAVFYLFKPTNTYDFLHKFLNYYASFPWDKQVRGIEERSDERRQRAQQAA